MSPLRATVAAARQIARTAAPRPVTTSTRAFTQSRQLRAGGHESHYDPPNGWLFGVKPGEKYEKEGWEGAMYWGFCGAMAFGIVAYAFKPDTSIQTWALEEARRRLEAEGILADPDTKKD
ncbi:ESSS subunit of NADH:ubiquinone oxidoreductase-domain-containing protein [Paraphoma chrysanthemicola]|nr:ESSS subunit of NADH:ubiquinone oxidoreductase-domain-containing protein [Paraphoma chrysanthemicola]